MNKFLFLGDSQTCRLLKQFQIKNSEVINLAKSGASVSEALTIFNKFLDTIESKEVLKQYQIVILLGTNDCRRILDAQSFDRGSYKKIVTIARKFFNSVFLLKVPPIPKLFPVVQHISLVNRFINSFSSISNVIIVDSYSLFMRSTFSIDLKCFESHYFHGRRDLVHLNHHGLRLMARLLQHFVRIPFIVVSRR